MIEFNRIFCDLHPNELVSNYCTHCTPRFTQNNATLDFALLASAPILRLMSRKEQFLSTRTSGQLTPRCRTLLEHASRPLNKKKVVLYNFILCRTVW